MRIDRLSKILVLTGLCIFLSGSLFSAMAQDVIRASGGTDLSIDRVQTGEFATLSGPSIRETASGQLVEGGTIILTLPAGYEWNDQLTATELDEEEEPGENDEITYKIIARGANNTDLDITFTSISSTEIVITIVEESETAGQGRGPGRIDISGLQVRPTSTDVPNEGEITNTGTTGPTINYGNLSTEEGDISVVNVETEPDGSGTLVTDQNLRAGDDLTVYAIARDLAGNFIENIALDDPEDWSLINTDGIQQTALSVSSNRQNASLSSQSTGSAQIRAFVDDVDLEPSGTVTITPRSASSISIDAQPSSTAIAGEVFDQQPIIELFDQFGNLVTTDSETEITATIRSGDGTLIGATSQTASEGVATFSDLSTETADDITLEFSGAELNPVVSNTITIQPNDPIDLTFLQQPRSTVTSNSISPAVEVQLLDQFGNIVPQKDVPITISNEDYWANNAELEVDTDEDKVESETGEGIAIFSELRIAANADEGDVTFDVSFDGINAPITSRVFSIIDDEDLAGFEVTDLSGNPITEKEAGESFDILIRAVDGSGDTFQDFEGSVDVTADLDILDNGDVISEFTTGDFTNGEYTISIRLGSTGTTRIYAENTTENRDGESNQFNVTPSNVVFNNTLFTTDPTQITADGESTSEITVQLRDEFENNLNSGGENITIETDAGGLSGDEEEGLSVAALDNQDGTYTTQLTSSTDIETANLEAFENGNSIGTITVDFTAGDVEELLIFLPEDGEGNIIEQTAGEEFQITIRAIDSNGNIVDSYSGELELSSNSTIDGNTTIQISGGETDHDITLNQAGTNITISAEDTETFGIEGTSDSFVVDPAAPSLTASNVLSNPGTIQNDGTSTSIITIVLRDDFGNRITENFVNDLDLELEQLEEDGIETGGQQPDAEITTGLSFNSTSFAYQAELTAGNTIELVEISANFNNSELAQKATVDIVRPNEWNASAPGPSSDDWNTAENWSLGTVPVETDFVIIPDIGDLPNLDLNIEIGSFLIEEGADLILFGGNSIDVSGLVEINGSLDIEDNTSLIVGGSLTGSGTFSSGESTDIEIGGDVTIQNLLARTDGTSLTFNGSAQQTITTPNLLIQRMEVVNDVLVTEGDLIDTAEIFVSEGNTLELQEGADITLDNLENINGDGSLILNDNTLVLRGDLSLLNLDTSEGTVVFGVRQGEDPANFDLQQQQIANLTQMRNAIINNTEGVRTFDDIIIDDDGALTLENGELIISSGRNFIANNLTYNNGFLTFRRSLSQPGWRLLSSPITNTFGDWFAGLTLQGMENTTFSDRQPNLLFYDETFEGTDNQRWRTPADATDQLTPGRGYFFFVFGEVEGDTDYNDSLPKTLTVTGQEHTPEASESHLDLNVTYTAEADTGFNLVGNPYGATINWDDESWVKENMDDVIYIWDEANNQYKTWNGISGSHGSGNIAPFQGFWVKANNEEEESDPSLQVSRDAKTTGGVFRKTQSNNATHEWPVLEMQVEGAGMQHSTHFTFTEDGRNNIDRRDAYRLLPFDTNTYLEIFTLLDDGTELAINNLPRKFGKPIELPLHVSGVNNGAIIDNTITLTWPELTNIPDEWEIILHDSHSNESINLRDHSFYDFELNARAKTPPEMNTRTNFRLVEKSMAKKQSARFTIEIDPGADADGVPDDVILNQNYPNPFNQTTTIEFGIPNEQRVKVEVFDVLGRRVQTITDQRYEAGYHKVEFNGRSLASGVYFYRLVTEEKTLNKQMTLIK